MPSKPYPAKLLEQCSARGNQARLAAGGGLPAHVDPRLPAHPLSRVLWAFPRLCPPTCPDQVLEFEAQPDGGVGVFWSGIQSGRMRNTSYVLQQVAPGVLAIESYTLFGVPVNETYYMLDYTEDGSYIFYFYCGALLDSTYHGAVVYTRDPDAPVPPELAARFAQAVRDAGLQELVPFEQYCTPTYDSTCTNIY